MKRMISLLVPAITAMLIGGCDTSGPTKTFRCLDGFQEDDSGSCVKKAPADASAGPPDGAATSSDRVQP
ncbi:MAG: hypothetical protein GMKNLPBB_01610 [Myxococcota bacterium]|nr:hypothetical protein [Myxococcota bacterium]